MQDIYKNCLSYSMDSLFILHTCIFCLLLFCLRPMQLSFKFFNVANAVEVVTGSFHKSIISSIIIDLRVLYDINEIICT